MELKELRRKWKQLRALKVLFDLFCWGMNVCANYRLRLFELKLAPGGFIYAKREWNILKRETKHRAIEVQVE